jgi:Asp-tRNA(Asn)/Glu-tRNA(Gln) amidotransferase A subunit family amidase
MGPTAAELELLDAALVGRAPSGPADLSGVRLAVPRAYYCDSLAPGVAEVFEVALARLSDAGCVLVERDVPGLETDIAGEHLTVVLHEAERIWRGYARTLGRTLADLAAEIATARVRRLFEALAAGEAPSATAYAAAHERLASVRSSVEDYLAEAGADALVAPAAPVTPPLTGPRPDAEEDAVFDLLTRNMLPATIARQPSACLPIGDDVGVGLLLDGRPGEDERLLALARAAEAVLA